MREIARGRSDVHAILLYGATGSGKNALARALIQAWLCTQPNEDGACGNCRACGAYERNLSADFLLVAPAGRSLLITLPAISNEKPGPDDPPTPVLTFFRTLPLAARHKVAFIESAERMNGSAANALLKTLEEPHPHAKLILTTDSIGLILPTILSRCLAVACEAPGESELRHAFPDASEEEIRIAEGAPGRLAQVLSHRAAYGRIIEFGRELRHRHAGEALVVSDALRLAGESLEKSLGCGARAANAETLEVLALYLSRDPASPPSWAQRVAEAHRRIVQNGQPGLVFDALVTALLINR